MREASVSLLLVTSIANAPSHAMCSVRPDKLLHLKAAHQEKGRERNLSVSSFPLLTCHWSTVGPVGH